MAGTDQFRVYAFDAYGTLFDVHSAVARWSAEVGPQAERLSELWRSKQLEYAWTRSLMGAYRDFWSLTEEALDVASARIGGVAPAVRARLLDSYRTLDPYPEAHNVLVALREAGAKVAILSNGSPEMLADAVAAAGWSDLFDGVLSVDAARIFKTDRRSYALVCERFEVLPAAVSFQSSNRWDVAGARSFGFATRWINRAGAPDEYRDLPPDRILSDLGGVLDG